MPGESSRLVQAQRIEMRDDEDVWKPDGGDDFAQFVQFAQGQAVNVVIVRFLAAATFEFPIIILVLIMRLSVNVDGCAPG
jgi:hypothetical protein